MDTGQLSEEAWRSLVLRYGPPVEACHLTADQVATAISESRLLLVNEFNDGHGDSYVNFDPAQTNRSGREYAHRWFCVAFPAPCRLTADTIQRLNDLRWEFWEEVLRVIITAELVAVLDQAADLADAAKDSDSGGSDAARALLAATIRSLRRPIVLGPLALNELPPIFAAGGAWDRVVGASGQTVANQVLALLPLIHDRWRAFAQAVSDQSAEPPKPAVPHRRRPSARTAAEELIEVLRAAQRLLAQPGNDFAWSSWKDADAAVGELDTLIAAIASGSLPPRLDVSVLFGPTGPIQEVSLSSGWGDAFLDLARRCDAALARAYA
jgi:hypothetical protein